jgi:hypothetical protein
VSQFTAQIRHTLRARCSGYCRVNWSHHQHTLRVHELQRGRRILCAPWLLGATARLLAGRASACSACLVQLRVSRPFDTHGAPGLHCRVPGGRASAYSACPQFWLRWYTLRPRRISFQDCTRRVLAGHQHTLRVHGAAHGERTLRAMVRWDYQVRWLRRKHTLRVHGAAPVGAACSCPWCSRAAGSSPKSAYSAYALYRLKVADPLYLGAPGYCRSAVEPSAYLCVSFNFFGSK